MSSLRFLSLLILGYTFFTGVHAPQAVAQNNITEAPLTGLSEPKTQMEEQSVQPSSPNAEDVQTDTASSDAAPAPRPATANNTSNSSEPIEITADGTLEWHRNNSSFIATKNALARQGDVSLAANKLTADYKDGNGSNFEIWRVRAADNVRIQSRDTQAFGDNADYDISTGFAEMTGSDLRLVSPDQTVTARDKFEYWTNEGRLVAIGDAVLTRVNEKGETNTLKADTLTAFMKDDQNGKRVLDRLEATGNVVITTPTETLTGHKGIYNATTNIAEITGNVQIKRGPNILEGTKADVNLTTNISRMFGGGNAQTRVRGVFYPNSKK